MQLYTKITSFYDNSTNMLELFKDSAFKVRYRELKYEDYIGKTTLITGESGSGKTEFTTGFILHAVNKINSELIQSEHNKNDCNFFLFIFDMAPKSFKKNNSWIGGKLTNFIEFDFSSRNFTIYDYEDIIPPRSRSTNKNNVKSHVEHNINIINSSTNFIFDEIINRITAKEKCKIFLIINDLSIYLHGNKPNELIDLMKLQESTNQLTIFLNAYEGTKLLEDFGSNLSILEKERVDALREYSDYAIKLL